jgi:hypothetical protein
MSIEEDFEKELKQIKKIVLENNEILIGLRSRARYSTLFSIIRWTIYIGIAIGLFTFLRPVVDNFVDIYRDFVENLKVVSGLKESASNISDIDVEKFSNILKK